jgi:acyl-CoA reductase-like NAD-dependent aldehyde dehydrogenase
MGGKNPLVVLDDCDFDRAVEVALDGAFFATGQRCTVNLPTAGVDYHIPFGGSRKSSYGAREQGFAAIEFYSQLKTGYSRL